MNGGNTGQWFNDRRFNFNGPQRLRESVTQILNDLNNQVGLGYFCILLFNRYIPRLFYKVCLLYILDCSR